MKRRNSYRKTLTSHKNVQTNVWSNQQQQQREERIIHNKLPCWAESVSSQPNKSQTYAYTRTHAFCHHNLSATRFCGAKFRWMVFHFFRVQTRLSFLSLSQSQSVSFRLDFFLLFTEKNLLYLNDMMTRWRVYVCVSLLLKANDKGLGALKFETLSCYTNVDTLA